MGDDGSNLPARRSGCCYDDEYPTMHALCSGRFSYRAGPNSSPEDHRCNCPCHTPGGAHLRRSS
jgi:hypothetical protein